MDQDEPQYKASKVTKPIELKPKSVSSSGLRRTGIQRPSDHNISSERNLSAEQPVAAAAVSVLPVSRRRKANARPEIVDQIGHRLLSVYNEVLSQPIPDRFLDLLSELEAGDPPARKTGTSAKKECK